MDQIDSLNKTINSILTMSTSGATIKILLLVLTIGCSVWFGYMKKKTAVSNSRKEEAKDDNENHNASVKQNNSDNQQVADDSKRIDDLLKGDKHE